MPAYIIGISASLRNARSKKGSGALLEEMRGLKTREQLDEYMQIQASIHLDQFKEAGRKDGAPFDELYKNLRKMGGLRGLSNSEVSLVAGLWGAMQEGAEIGHISLLDHFPANGDELDLDKLKSDIRKADGIILSTPVYFGDRSSLSQRFIEMIRADEELSADIKGRLYAGISVGAKRNGGQETSLIYQMQDMLNIGFLAVGNDSDTTSQYGGTGHAGDIGTMPEDVYGVNTCIGTGRRIAKVSTILRHGNDSELTDLPELGMWLLQDKDKTFSNLMGPLMENIQSQCVVNAPNILGKSIRPCIACDICPTHVEKDNIYRCIIARRDDGMKELHDEFLEPDILMPGVYSPINRNGLRSVYQQFMERTRYLRRGDYVFTDHLVAPLIVEELGANEHMDIRMMTSFIRHHTVMHKPIVAWAKDGEILNAEDVIRDLESALEWGRKLLIGRLVEVKRGARATAYNPVGYVLSQAKDNEQSTIDARKIAIEERQKRYLRQADGRLKPVAIS